MPKLAAVMVPDTDGLRSRVTRHSIDILDACELALQSCLIDVADDGLDLRLFDSQVANAVACRDGRNQLGGGDLVTPKAQPASGAVGPHLRGWPDGELAIECLILVQIHHQRALHSETVTDGGHGAVVEESTVVDE